ISLNASYETPKCLAIALLKPGIPSSTIFSSCVISLPWPCTRLNIIAISDTGLLLPTAASPTSLMYFSKSFPSLTPAANAPAATSVPSAIVVIPPSIAFDTWSVIEPTSFVEYPSPSSLALALSKHTSLSKHSLAVIPAIAGPATYQGLVILLVSERPIFLAWLPTTYMLVAILLNELLNRPAIEKFSL